jgi:GNAT superfamily N-acetyltransferase
MSCERTDVVVRVAARQDVAAVAALRSLWSGDGREDPDFERRLGAWIAAEGDRRTTWLAMFGDSPVGMASLFEYRRMPRPGRPDGRWGYIANMYVREELRRRGIGSSLLAAVTAAADERHYARLVLSPSAEAVAFYRRAGFVIPDEAMGEDRLLVRHGRPR